MKLGIVIPATHGREENLALVAESVQWQALVETPVVIVDDGGELDYKAPASPTWHVVPVAKHTPGMEQPRNVGVRVLTRLYPDVTHVLFLDSDVVLKHGALAEYEYNIKQDESRILVGPYEWLPEGLRPPPRNDDPGDFWREATAIENDPRWEMFRASPPTRLYRDDLAAALACFSGNLVWPVAEFVRVGGFWSELHHGRCEDGELGLRASAMGVPISFAKYARGFHLWHPVNTPLALERNTRDVPMLNERHPWVQQAGVILSDRDGAAFDVDCRCGNRVHTIGWWEHAALCPMTGMELPV